MHIKGSNQTIITRKSLTIVWFGMSPVFVTKLNVVTVLHRLTNNTMQIWYWSIPKSFSFSGKIV